MLSLIERAGIAQTNARELVQKDGPAVYWRFSETADQKQPAATTGMVGKGALWGRALLGQAGPRPPRFPHQEPINLAAEFMGTGDFIKVLDPGDASLLDFNNGDSITIEAWVNPRSIKNDQYAVIVEKGRTGNPGFDQENLNYAMRLHGQGDVAALNFLFRSVRQANETSYTYHRWTSNETFPIDSGWHHLALSYSFGNAESIRGYIDGKPIVGTWDMGGATQRPPVVDNDELWIGSGPSNHSGSFHGWIDELAIYRSIVPPESIAARFVAAENTQQVWPDEETLSSEHVQVQVFEGLPNKTWSYSLEGPTFEYHLPAMALNRLPNKYNSSGVIDDRKAPFLVQMTTKRRLEAGKYRFLIRSKSGVRLLVDGKQVALTPFQDSNGDGHEAVPDLLEPLEPGMHPAPHGHREATAEVDLSDGNHVFRLDAIIGGRTFRQEPGEICFAYAAEGESFLIMTPDSSSAIPFTVDAWQHLMLDEALRIQDLNRAIRKGASQDYEAYWERRHEMARQIAAAKNNTTAAKSIIDEFFTIENSSNISIINSPIEDLAFLRRVTLDTVGRVPSLESIEAFQRDQAPDKRSRWIDDMLAQPSWADAWVGYWQDVLAENPGIVKPEQNNTGPFRWWIYESMLDNKPIDRFATELIMMEGSKYYGGPAGFGMASQNDAPMAAKAQVLAKAFLGMDFSCARCHDAPSHPFMQRELFSLAAMLQRDKLTLPKSSTVPPNPDGRQPLISISLKPGDQLPPEWKVDAFPGFEIPEGILRNANDLREQFAVRVTSPTNPRFAKVVVNRVWHRYMGWGLVEPVDDWDSASADESPLLDFLADRFVESGYDLKHVAKLILSSRVYQQQPLGEQSIRKYKSDYANTRHYPPGPARRRMTAEQLVDSLVFATGKPLDVEPMSLDPEGRRPPDQFLHLGVADRAWQLASTSTDRDRPALNMPATQQVVDVLTTFGWRDARPSPQTVRDDSASPMQSLVLGNGWTATRIARLTDDHTLTKLALQDQSLDVFTAKMFFMALGRTPTSTEKEWIDGELKSGFEDRRSTTKGSALTKIRSWKRNPVSWANHLVPRATEIKLELEQEILRGDLPTDALQTSWRERLEDVWWALINSPEFVFVP